ncbi:uncharacterized protein N7529_004581 [Penicillium soppii]|uniref:uncharacterized protein n=1 Tax=Penicillium soppii TaxID=69789 RepID=UPI00254766AA|nr:uncharacterized protein N7529_004581 [Penicillium soppii]KAJ5872228.1 hypothetical protein N7529_004581 [Penicillium soppii]
MSVHHPRPEPNPWKNDSPKELIDRCWSILSYIPWITYLKLWENVLLFLTGPRNDALLYDRKIPQWVQPRPSLLRLSQLCFSPVPLQSSPATAPLLVKLVWDTDWEFEGKPLCWRHLATLAVQNINPPKKDHIMTQDPRLCISAASLRDVVRRLMDCGIHGLNLHALTLSYHSREDNCYYHYDALRSQWKVLKGMFSDPDNTNFVLKVVLEAHSGKGDIFMEIIQGQ